MTTTEDNVQKLKQAYALWNERKPGTLGFFFEMIDDDVRWRSLGGGAPSLEFTRERTGKDDVRRYFEELVMGWELIHFTPEEYIAQDDRVVMRGRCGFRCRRTGKVVETPKADFFRFRDGKVVDFYEFYDTAGALAATR
jgi:ketosteroid isomerase-like protein